MKIFNILCIMFILITVKAQASTVILTDGQVITGDISHQDNAKVVLKEGDFSLTYYKNEIVSIDGVPVSGEGNGAMADAEKEKMIEQLNIFFPVNDFVSDWVESSYPPETRERVLASLNQGQNILAIKKIIEDGLNRYFTSADMQAMIKFVSSPEGKKCEEDFRAYSVHTMPEFFKTLKAQLNKTTKDNNQNN